MEETKKPKYGLGQSVRFMLGMAWKYRRSTIWVCLLYAAIQLGLNLCQLFIAPVVLGKVEQAAPLPELLGSIGVFSCFPTCAPSMNFWRFPTPCTREA